MTRQDILNAVRAAIEISSWSIAREQPGDGALAYEGIAPGWRFLVVGFDVSDQGFPPGTLGYDGTALATTSHPMALRLPRELSELGFSLAKKQAS